MYRGKTIDVLAKETNINKKGFYESFTHEIGTSCHRPLQSGH